MKTRESADRIEDLKKELILSSEEDYLDLSAFSREVADALKLRGKDGTREATLRLVAELLEEGHIRAGIPTVEGGFEAWDEHLVEIVARIDGEWRRLGRPPELGEVVWFEATETGESYAASSLIAH